MSNLNLSQARALGWALQQVSRFTFQSASQRQPWRAGELYALDSLLQGDWKRQGGGGRDTAQAEDEDFSQLPSKFT